MPSPSEVAAFQLLIAKIAGLAADKAAAVVAASPNAAILAEAYPDIIDPYLQAAAQVTTEWYHSNAPEARFPVEAAPPVERGALKANAQWAVKQLDPAAALAGSSERQVFNTSRETVSANAKREKVRFARHAREDACAWCRMLATRGAVYWSEDTATFGHDHCYCVAVPDRPGNPYVPADYVKQWEDDYKKASLEESGTDDIVNNMRRRDYARNKEAINAQQREWYRARKARKAGATLEDAVLESAASVVDSVVDVVDLDAGQPIDELDKLLQDSTAAFDAGDDERGLQLLDDAEKLEKKRAKSAAAKERRRARKAAKESEKMDRVVALVDEEGWDPVEAESHVYGTSVEKIRRREFIRLTRAGGGYSGAGFDELVSKTYKTLMYEQYYKAEAATRGHMLKPKYQNSYDPARLWRTTERRAKEVMSSEMAAWFDEHGRITLESYRASILAGQGSQAAKVREDFLQ